MKKKYSPEEIQDIIWYVQDLYTDSEGKVVARDLTVDEDGMVRGLLYNTNVCIFGQASRLLKDYQMKKNRI